MNRRITDLAPLPVARAYRQMFENPDPSEAFHSITLFSEPLTKWFGVLALVSLRERLPQAVLGGGLLPQFLAPSMGDWVQVIRLATRSAAELSPYAPLPDAFAELLGRQPEAARAATRRIEEYLETELAKKTPLDFLGSCVTYRNKTRGHGAPSLRHRAEFASVLLEAWDELLPALGHLYRLRLVHVERSENIGPDALHTLRDCNGLHSSLMPEKLSLPKARALSSRCVYLFSEDHAPLIELSPILVRHPSHDSFYFLNSGRKALEYLSYDGDREEYYRPEGLDTAVRRFFGESEAIDDRPTRPNSPPPTEPAPSRPDDDIDLPFGDLGVRGRRAPSSGHAPTGLIGWLLSLMKRT